MRTFLGKVFGVERQGFVEEFRKQGFVVESGLARGHALEGLQTLARDQLAKNIAPIEFEVDVQYPGAPKGPDAPGASTARRLLQAYNRDPAFALWATSDVLKTRLQALLGSSDVSLSLCHHNCVMTKQPGFSSATLWHQDNRYWSFDQENLISVWLALTDEYERNGCLNVIPSSHSDAIAAERLDSALFLRDDTTENQKMIEGAVPVSLQAGDVLFFHSRLFHAAGRNESDQTKLSLVYTYHAADNQPVVGTRSARLSSVVL